MKATYILTGITLSYLYMTALTSCHNRIDSASDELSRKIDSLVEVQQINKRCILITFGSDAITSINSKRGIVVIDAGISTGLTARYRKIIEKDFQRNDFAYVINTHGHFDHNGGNSVFPKARIVGHENCLQEITEHQGNPEKVRLHLKKISDDYDSLLQTTKASTKEWDELFTQKIRYQSAFNDVANNIKIKQPDVTFSDSLTIDLGDVTLEMFYFGKCHSSSDMLVYVPEMSILFTGDLMTRYGSPSFGDNMTTANERNVRGVRWIEKRMDNIKTIIGGHGQILSLDGLKSFNDKILERQ
jgi:glyoxylase-like metal-dependent hydrolase (beta-lactamase superfamily II)